MARLRGWFTHQCWCYYCLLYNTSVQLTKRRYMSSEGQFLRGKLLISLISWNNLELNIAPHIWNKANQRKTRCTELNLLNWHETVVTRSKSNALIVLLNLSALGFSFVLHDKTKRTQCKEIWYGTTHSSVKTGWPNWPDITDWLTVEISKCFDQTYIAWLSFNWIL